MSWHLPHQFTTLHRAVSIALSCSISLLMPVAQAAMLGPIHITSQQHEPLIASISVSDIDTANFNATIANPSMYRQMGLTPTAAMSIRFVPSSATSGQLLIRTAQPVSAPFADVVLNLTDNSQRRVIPKTLLMPLGGNVSKTANQAVSRALTPALPIAFQSNVKPLAVKRSAPPPLFNTPAQLGPAINKTAPMQAQTLSAVSVATLPALPMTVVTQANPTKQPNNKNKSLTIASLQQASPSFNQSKDFAPQIDGMPQSNEALMSNARIENSPPTNTSIHKQLDTLNIQVTRQIKMRDHPVNQLINNTISQKNNVAIKDSLAQLRPDSKRNPDAFINTDANRLKADAILDLLNYKIVPSPQSLQTTSAAQTQYDLQQGRIQKPSATNRLATNVPKKPLEATITSSDPAASTPKATPKTALATTS